MASKITLKNSEVKKVVLKNREDLNSCYQDYVSRGFNAQGRVIFKWNIHPSGKVSHIKPVRSIDSHLDRCLVKKIRQWNFPKTGNDQIAEVRFPFVFKNQIKRKKAKEAL